MAWGEWERLESQAAAKSPTRTRLNQAAAIAVPLVYETAGSAGETALGNQTIDWLKDNEYNNDQESIDSIQDAREQGAGNAMTPLLNYAEHEHMSAHEVRQLTERARSAYGAGGNDSDTDDARGW
ncbi:hypothetical protein [Streptomyces murinus]|uniref:Uncharacterized protein n=1 Tax=Streptomyces murinus TaxID=33900 RepID=A0A7W3NRL1_STRMR|nr:hypothetical protein [Streptomyces murinus]MBA9055372.1 hypothetical protein [Streptomyces murinus]UWW89963.1 hypothetical protein GO605_03210 [Streptomyces murinus]